MTDKDAHSSELMPPPTAACPLTGQASQQIQTISTKYLRRLWRYTGAGDVSRCYGQYRRIGLYASPCGLIFFHPAKAGDADFYERLYAHVGAHRQLGLHPMRRVEHIEAAAFVRAGDAVLEVGCGAANFRRHIPSARYAGLDPMGDGKEQNGVFRETIAEHADRHPGEYDLVCAFQVVEHVEDPLGFTREMIRAAKPGGLVLLCAPLHPSVITGIINNPINAPPHHLSWWNCPAYEALLRETGLERVKIAEIAPPPHLASMFWMHRLMPYRIDPAKPRYFIARMMPNLALLMAWWLARPLAAIFGLPRNATPVDVLFVGRKPAG